MAHSPIIFEHPLSERMRLFLRVEHLANKMEYFRKQEDSWEGGAALLSLVELFSLFDRNDIKSEITKELERHTQRLTRLQGIEGINTNALNQILAELEQHSRTLLQSSGKPGQMIRDDDLLNNVRQRLTIPGGMCNFDTPSFHFWLNSSFSIRQTSFNHWLSAFTPIARALNLILHLTRESATLQPEIAYKGFYQKSIEAGLGCSLMQIQYDKNLGVFPEISGGKYRISIRFSQFVSTAPHSSPCNYDVPFQLRCCVV